MSGAACTDTSGSKPEFRWLLIPIYFADIQQLFLSVLVFQVDCTHAAASTAPPTLFTIYNPQMQSQAWIIAVAVVIAAVVILLATSYCASRRHTHHRTPSQIEAGLNRDCTNIIQ
jgi:Na+/melibiose symporter-like transporter